ncbi:hypothetical protein EYZ11_003235 [Aspergillus tanneri]|uniref:Uncharacterized protein n=1 Tax=Aspergillus tanneri TaxID=1220188 RepID=A0A4S3JQY6_9EURO|nr:hypothetical protein EYZ11_003235 [Aspergillus tanneri]
MRETGLTGLLRRMLGHLPNELGELIPLILAARSVQGSDITVPLIGVSTLTRDVNGKAGYSRGEGRRAGSHALVAGMGGDGWGQ